MSGIGENIDFEEENKEEKKVNVFDKQYELIFFKNVDGKIMSRLPNGKYTFLNRGEIEKNLVLGLPYLCQVRELENYAFAKIISSVFIPRILVLKDERILVIYKDQDNVKREVKPLSDLMEYVMRFKEAMVVNRVDLADNFIQRIQNE